VDSKGELTPGTLWLLDLGIAILAGVPQNPTLAALYIIAVVFLFVLLTPILSLL
jgi:hypothetical protein